MSQIRDWKHFYDLGSVAADWHELMILQHIALAASK